MKISDYLIKKQWCRRTRTSGTVDRVISSLPAKTMMELPKGSYISFTQDKFLDEIHSGAHIIWDRNYRSARARYKYDEKTGENIFDHYEDVTRVAVSWQQAIRINKTAVCGGNPTTIMNESGSENAEKVSIIKSYINTCNLRAALLQHFYSIFGTGDGALYFYKEDDSIQWRIFTYENGDNCTITTDYEYPEQEMGVRFFNYNGHNAVEFYRNKYIELYVQYDKDTKPLEYESVTEDNYYLLKRKAHGISEYPFAYYREHDIPSGPVQNLIEEWESTLSDCGEDVKYYAFQILFLVGGAIDLPEANFPGKVMGSPTSEGDAKILEPADASNVLEITFKKLYNSICDGSKSVFIKPDELRGQNDSGAYIANLYWPEIQWATLFYGRYHHCMAKILRIIKQYVGLIQGDMQAYKNLRIKYAFNPYIPQNKLEQSTILQQGVTAGFISVETATEESSYSNPLELQRLKAMKHDEKNIGTIKGYTKYSQGTQ